MKKPGYPIRAVSKLTGLSIDTLRAWERRYEAISPQRNGRGRVYTEADVERLNLLREAVEKGHSIGQIAGLSDQQLKELLGRSAILAARVQHSLAARTVPVKLDHQAALSAIGRYDYAAAELELNRLATLLSPREMVREVIIPLMEKIGDQWYRGAMSIAQEHMTSAILRNLLGALIRLYARTAASSVLLFATPAGEMHEFGILCSAMLAAGGGLGIVYLGVNLPPQEIIDAARKTSPQVVVLGLKAASGPKDSLKALRHISQKLPEKVEVWVGGTKSEELMREIKQSRAIFLPDFDALERQLARLGAKF